MADPQVLVVGAGPTGMVLALWMTRAGVPVRLVDASAGPGTTSRALAVHARTLEHYRQLGIAAEAVERGVEFRALNLWVRGRRVGRAPFGDIGAGISPYPYVLSLPQDEHERLLEDALARAGVRVERGTTLVALQQDAEGVHVRLRDAAGAEASCSVSWLAGCDGARSAVRSALAVGFPGATYTHLFYVADVEGEGPVVDGELHVALDDAAFLGVFPMREAGRVRLVGNVPAAIGDDAAPGWEDVRGPILGRVRLDVRRVRWFSTYRVHHRVAGRFRDGRVFLLGDAAHIHSPVGGQGMNTGIGDAVNLAWKLAAVLRGTAPPALLDSYEPERIAFARRLVATTDRAFALVTSRARLATFVRLRLVPLVVPPAFALRLVRRLAFRVVSQTAIRYRAGALRAGRAGRVRGGDRLPWVPDASPGGGDNHAALASRAWQVHVYGEASPALAARCAARALPLHAFAHTRPAGRAGLRRGAAYLVRPDGWVAVAEPAGDGEAIARFLDALGLRAGR